MADSVKAESDSSFAADFEKRVRSALESAGMHQYGISLDGSVSSGTSVPVAGAAVSGGADSVSLLVSLVHIFGAENVRAVTVNHNIRPDSETRGDAEYVESLCAKLSVPCTTAILERGEVDGAAKENGWSTEEAARILRYRAFDSFIKKSGVSFLCLAHNMNDNLETLLMRFLQGSGTEGLCGIASVRGKYIRPLLGITRSEIERYLTIQQTSWRTDSTNSDNSYVRNKIRNILVPELTALMPGWQNALLAGAEKNRNDDDALSALAVAAEKEILVHEDNEVKIAADKFYGQSRAVQRRLVYRAFSLCGAEQRVPYTLVQSVMSWSISEYTARNPVKAEAAGILVELRRGIISVKKGSMTATECGFFGILKEDNRLVRSIQSGDTIRAADDSMRSVSGIFSSWHVRPCDRNRIPLVQDLYSPEQPLVAVLGSVCGYPDWIVGGFRAPEKESK